jgi:L-lactate utilization protein LutC
MTSKEKILNNLRRVRFDKEDVLPVIKDYDIYKDVLNTKAELIRQFSDKIRDLEGEVYVTESPPEAALLLVNIFRGLPVQSVLVQSDPLIDRVIEKENALKPYIDPTARFSISSIPFADYKASITVADYLVARTGSIILNCKSAGGRRLSVLPSLHIVIAETHQIVPSLDKALHLLKEESQSYSYMTIITGASRTSDIEKQLVLGAHGPKRLVVILIDR